MPRLLPRLGPLGLLLLVLLGALLPAAAPAQAPPQAPVDQLKSRLAASMRQAGRASGAYVVDASNGEILYSLRSSTTRVLASNTKLFTTAAALDRYGAGGRIETTVAGTGSLLADGTWHGNLYLRGSGDPTFGSADFNRRKYAGGANIEDLVSDLRAAGVQRVHGRVLGDETLFDFLRGTSYSGYGLTRDIGPLSALSFNHGYADSRGRILQSNPPGFAATKLTQALERAGIDVRGGAGIAPGPVEGTELASVESPPMARLAQITNTRSDNFFAETLLKGLPAAPVDGRRPEGEAIGTTAAGARLSRAFAHTLGARPKLVDGSGLSRRDKASPQQIVRLLQGMQTGPEAQAFISSLAVAGRSGTLAARMRRSIARDQCHAKTGTLSNVSALSGYCETRGGTPVAFSILMNGVRPIGAQRLQDRMAEAIVRFTPPPEGQPAP